MVLLYRKPRLARRRAAPLVVVLTTLLGLVVGWMLTGPDDVAWVLRNDLQGIKGRAVANWWLWLIWGAIIVLSLLTLRWVFNRKDNQ